jgi:hypothetical protein
LYARQEKEGQSQYQPLAGERDLSGLSLSNTGAHFILITLDQLVLKFCSNVQRIWKTNEPRVLLSSPNADGPRKKATSCCSCLTFLCLFNK